MKLAKVTSATLEIKERGILNFWVMVDYEDGLSQGVGGLTLDDYDKELKRRVGSASKKSTSSSGKRNDSCSN